MTDKPKIELRKTEMADLEVLFQFQIDEEAAFMAGFMSKDHADKNVYIEKYKKFLSDPTIFMRTIWLNENIVGSVAKYEMDGDAEITYWIDKKYWGQGIATIALNEFLKLETTRPIFGRAAFDNMGSQRVLEKCGFEKIGTDRGFAFARKEEIEEVIYKLM
jgi:ribosomal-protein-alanine N-acetyltransferase